MAFKLPFLLLSVLFIAACADKYENQVNDIHYATAITENRLHNSDFVIWQRGASLILPDKNSSYLADRWFSRNDLGTGSRIEYKRVEEFYEGSRYGASMQVIEPPHANPGGTIQITQTLENYDSLRFANQRATFSVRVKALGRVNAIGIQFISNATEVVASEPLGPEVVFPVSSDKYSMGTVANVDIGGSFVPAGVLGVRIRVAGVSSGNLYDLDNGMVVRQAMLNFGAAPGPFRTRFEDVGNELTACQRYYEKSYSIDDAPGTVTQNGEVSDVIGHELQGFNRMRTLEGGPVRYQKTKRIPNPLIKIYDPRKGGSGGWHHRGETEAVGTIVDQSSGGFTILAGNGANEEVYFHWSTDAEIYPAPPKP